MKVFSLLSLYRKSDSFQRNEDKDNTHFLYSHVAMHLTVHLPHTIQVWGLVSFIRFGFCQSLCIDKRKSAPHFLFFINSLSELVGVYGFMDLSAIINSLQDAVLTAPIGISPSSDDKTVFQEALKEKFEKHLRRVISSEVEFVLSGAVNENVYDLYNDKCDVYVETERYVVIVELDTTRADQVAKKMLSRFYYADKYTKPVVYVCLLYLGTANMSPNECIKYMHMGKDVLLSMNSSNRFIGAFINGSNFELKLIG